MNFGEIIETSSRAFWDGFEEYDEESCPPIKLEWNYTSKNVQYIKNVKKIYLLEGTNVHDFAKYVFLKNDVLVCKVDEAKVFAYFSEASKTLIYISEDGNLNLSSSLTELLIPSLNVAEEVTTITVLPKNSYKSCDLNEFKLSCFVKGIDSKLKNVQQLKTPNFITGLSAGVANWRYFKNAPISSYIVYTESDELDNAAVKTFIGLLQDLGFKCKSNYISKLKNESHLYM